VSTFPLPQVELDLVLATLDFANAEIESARQVEGFFRGLPLPRRWWPTMGRAPDAVEAFKRDQGELKRWLESIARTGSVTKADERLIAKRLRETVKVQSVLDLDAGELVERRTYLFEGVQASYSFATALLLKFAERLGRCRFPKCEQFFFETRTRGAPSLYCSTRHANADRQRRFRQPTIKRR
jgi:hypothetical protein